MAYLQSVSSVSILTQTPLPKRGDVMLERSLNCEEWKQSLSIHLEESSPGLGWDQIRVS